MCQSGPAAWVFFCAFCTTRHQQEQHFLHRDLPAFCDDSLKLFLSFFFLAIGWRNAESDKGLEFALNEKFAFSMAGGGPLLRLNFSAGLSNCCLPHRPHHGPSTHRARVRGPPRD